ncbi:MULTISPECIES: SH3-like domain-containing protein [unclassified Asaia]|uniref:SH3-like domain-containing protein n=1 Tax=unclassified Asaia TaxID=2685023 RepID=UPI0018F7A1EA|nr:SH3-like domain-containing protein [Asaia sp. W19]
MNGIHDLGGMHGMGPVNPPASEPVFAHVWEGRIFALFIATFAGGHFNVDEFRHEIELMDPATYLRSSYYEHWVHAIEALLISRQVLSVDDIGKRMREGSAG